MKKILFILILGLIYSQNILPGQKNAILQLIKIKDISSSDLDYYLQQTYGKSIDNISKVEASIVINSIQSGTLEINRTIDQSDSTQTANVTRNPVLADVLEVGMSKSFRLVGDNVINGEIINIKEGVCDIRLKDSKQVLNIPMVDILEETAKITKKDESKFSGPVLSEDSDKITIRSNYGDIEISKKDIERMDRYHGGVFEPYAENKKNFYQGEANLVSVFLDPLAFTLSPNTFYVSGLSIGYGFTDRFQVTSKIGEAFNENLNIHAKFRPFHKKTATLEQAASVGVTVFRSTKYTSIISKYSHLVNYTENEVITPLNESGADINGVILNSDDPDSRSMFGEIYFVYSYRRKNPTGRGNVGLSVGAKTNTFSLVKDSIKEEFVDGYSWADNIYPYRVWASFEYDLQKRLKVVGSLWVDSSWRTRGLPEVLEDYVNLSLDSPEGRHVPIDFDFGFLYAVNDNFRVGLHFQQPYIDFYWEFFEF